MIKWWFGAIAVAMAATACGHTPSQLGVLVDVVGVTRAPTVQARDSVAEGLPLGPAREKSADVVGTDEPEVLARTADEKTLEIRSRDGQVVARLPTVDYLTDFGATPNPEGGKDLLILYSYPNSDGGGTFRVLEGAGREVSTWRESPPTGAFTVGEWRNQAALFYLQGDALIVRSPMGVRLQRLEMPEGRMFRAVSVKALANGRVVAVSSGTGYTPYHMVCIFSGDSLLFREVEPEHAFGVEVVDGGAGFVVTGRSTAWKYLLNKP